MKQQSHEEFVKKQNEWCFLPNKQKINAHGFTFLEIITLDQFNELKKSLDRLYSGVRQHVKDNLKLDKFLDKDRKMLTTWGIQNLPWIADNKLKGKILHDSVFFDLPKYVEFIEIKLIRSLPSFVILQCTALFNKDYSEDLNKPIYKYHQEKKEKVISPKGEYTKIFLPNNQKTNEIEKIREEVKVNVYSFISKFIRGYFLDLIEIEGSEIVPSFEIYSLKLPKKDEIKKWFLKNSNFFQCFGLQNYDSAVYNNYYFLREETQRKDFVNYAFLADYNLANTNMYSSKESSIIGELSFTSLDLFAISRMVEYQEREINRINSSFGSTFLNKKIKDAIHFREKVISKIFLYENLSTEFKNYEMIPDKPPFEYENKKKLFELVLDFIKERMKIIDNHISKIIKQSEIFVSLKNIEYNYKTQNKMLWLTILILFLTIASILTTLLIKPEIILRIIFG